LAFHLAADGISGVLILLTAVTTVITVAASRETTNQGSFFGWLLSLNAFATGAFASHDLLLFFLFFEATLVPSYFLIARWGGANKARAAATFFTYTFVASAPLFIATLFLGLAHQNQAGGPLTFSYDTLTAFAATLPVSTQVWIFVAMGIAFAVKSPIFPFHTWSPLTYAEAPTEGSVLFSALLAKLGSYGLLRFVVAMLPGAVPHVRGVVMTLGVIGILYGSLAACATKDLKRLIAYSSLAQMGFVTVGVVSGSMIATAGAVLLMFNHGVISLGLFVLVGWIVERRGTYEIAGLRGLQGPAPVLAAVFTVVMLASIGLPGLSGFVSEFMILLGTFNVHPWWAVVAGLGVIGAAAYLLWAYQRVFHGETDEPNAAVADLTTYERVVMAPVVALTVALGVYPQPILNLINPAVKALVAHISTSGVLR
jgi:NADH-quinone oxidoreductase subunit M